MGYSIHAGQVIVADGTSEMKERISSVLTNDPGIGVTRHADAGYNEAIQNANDWDIDIPMIKKKMTMGTLKLFNIGNMVTYNVMKIQ